MAVKYDQYSNAKPFYADIPIPLGTSGLDADRLRSYDLYEQIFWNHPEVLKLLQRGEDENPIYMPSGRQIIEGTGRFLAVDFDYVVSPGYGSDADRLALGNLFTQLFRRERFWAKFHNQKRMGLIRGDAVWHITADPAKPQGSRISIKDIHPGMYFPIMDPNDGTRVVGVHLVDTALDPRDPDKVKTVSRRQTYRKDDVSGTITSELTLWEPGKWDDRKLKPQDLKMVQVLVPVFTLDPRINVIPVYHLKNGEADPFGSSTLRGIETLIAAVSQTVSDTSLAWAIAGLGQYWTNASPPVDANGQPTAWDLGPLRVAEVPEGNEFGRVDGVNQGDSATNFSKFLQDSAATGVGVPEIAIGKVDVSVAESGISLMMQLAPIIAANRERESTLLGLYDQMFYDISTKWLAVYEQFGQGPSCEVVSVVGDPMPINRDAVVKEVLDLFTAGLITIEMAQARLSDIGYEFPTDAATVVVDQAKALAEARNPDPFLNRARTELDTLVPSGNQGQVTKPGAPAINGSVVGV